MKPLMQSTEADIAALDAVCERLSGFGVEATTEWVDGFLTALVAGRRIVPPSEWLLAMFGEDFARAFADPQDVQQAMAALTGRWNVLASQLDPGSLIDAPDQLRLTPLMMVYDDEIRRQIVESGDLDAEEAERLQTGSLWCMGFQDAIDAFPDDWPEPDPGADDAALYDDCLSSVVALVLEGDDHDTYLRDSYPDQTVTRDELIDDACFAVQDLRLYWLDHGPRPEPRRVEPRPGRNDPCPCGSGRKYKKCHGADLH